jgi:hypothetical protein
MIACPIFPLPDTSTLIMRTPYTHHVSHTTAE